jgi:hypothetical protein
VCIENFIRFDCVVDHVTSARMVGLISFLLKVVASLFKSRSQLEAENAALRHQLIYPTAEWIAQQITEAFPWSEAPRYLIRDQDGIYGAAVARRLRAMGIATGPCVYRMYGPPPICKWIFTT